MLGLLSDAHGNLPGLLKGLKVLERNGARRFAFLGDAVGYIPNWDVVDELSDRRDDFMFVLGNHEEAVLAGHITSRDAVYRHAALRDGASASRMEFLKSWRSSIRLELACGSALLVHGSPDDTQNGYIYPDTQLDLTQFDDRFLFCGHTHRPFIRQIGLCCVTNIGSCGLPRDDGRYGSVGLLDEESGKVSILRYELEPETRLYLGGHADIHNSVTDLFARRSNDVFGSIDV